MTPERLAKIQAVLARRTNHLVLVMDNVYDPHNFAAVLRSAEAAGLQEVHIIATFEKFQLERKISKGCERWLTLHFWQDYESCFAWLRKEGRRLYATALLPTSEKPALHVAELPLDTPLALIFGNEHRGVSQESLKACDATCFLPMYGFVESLNISASVAAILGTLVPELRKNPACLLSEERKAAILAEWQENEPKRTQE